MMVILKHYLIWDNLRPESGFQKLLVKVNFGAQKTHRPHKDTSQLVPSNNYGLTEGDISQMLVQLQQIMKDEEEVINHQLTLRSLAETLAVHPNKLS